MTVREYKAASKAIPTRAVTPTEDCPVDAVSWFEAARYCNWLSRHEGLEPCYVEDDRGGRDQILEENYSGVFPGIACLPRRNSNMPVARGTTTGSVYFGQTKQLLGHYGWFVHNAIDRSWPVGTKKPNDFGLFDMLGNVRCWCTEQHRNYPVKVGQVLEDVEDDDLVCRVNDQRVLRGGWFGGYPNYLRQRRPRLLRGPDTIYGDIGFRGVRDHCE